MKADRLKPKSGLWYLLQGSLLETRRNAFEEHAGKPEAMGNKRFLREADRKENEKHLLKGPDGERIPGLYEPGYEPIDSTRRCQFSSDTMATYCEQCENFAKWAKRSGKQMGYRSLAEARGLIPEYMAHELARYEAGEIRPDTLATERAALTKGFQLSRAEASELFPKLPKRSKGNVIRSRGETAMDAKLPEKYGPFDEFLESTGLRRKEARKLMGGECGIDGFGAYVFVRQGKGGRQRKAHIIGTPEYVRQTLEIIRHTPKGEHVWKVPAHMAIHKRRRNHLQEFYRMGRRRPEDIPQDEKYYAWEMGEDGKPTGRRVWYDMAAAKATSAEAGHNRADVTVDRYLLVADGYPDDGGHNPKQYNG